MYEILPEIWKLMNQLMTSIFLLTTNLSWWLMKQEKVLTVLTVSNFIEFDLFRVGSIFDAIYFVFIFAQFVNRSKIFPSILLEVL